MGLETKQLILTPQEALKAANQYRVIKRSVDARQRNIKVLLTVQLPDQEGVGQSVDYGQFYPKPAFKDVHQAQETVTIIGAGPAGLFAALTLLEHGVKPIVYERGKDIHERKKDIALLNRNAGLNPESNYCFGEGGAGTFSDGKLFSRSKKRGDMQRIMELFHYFGADDKILYESHAHIGSDKLPSIIERMRQCIIEHGGEIHFNQKVEHFDFSHPTILAIGHSAHDTYHQLYNMGVAMECKGFAMGVRIEHPQELINDLLYHRPSPADLKALGNASYSLVSQVNGRGVYSFCMCPGGHIVPASTSSESCIVNGMSASHRNSPYANSGIIVEIRPEDLPHADALAGLRFQEYTEHLAWQNGKVNSIAPAQRLTDFVYGKYSNTLPTCSYLPGNISSRLDEWLPKQIGPYLRQGFKAFDKKYPGYLTSQAIIVGVESRSSSPIRILRDPITRASVNTPNLYPCGEGAGYAGGITSSAMDGIQAAKAICLHVLKKY